MVEKVVILGYGLMKMVKRGRLWSAFKTEYRKLPTCRIRRHVGVFVEETAALPELSSGSAAVFRFLENAPPLLIRHLWCSHRLHIGVPGICDWPQNWNRCPPLRRIRFPLGCHNFHRRTGSHFCFWHHRNVRYWRTRPSRIPYSGNHLRRYTLRRKAHHKWLSPRCQNLLCKTANSDKAPKEQRNKPQKRKTSFAPLPAS